MFFSKNCPLPKKFFEQKIFNLGAGEKIFQENLSHSRIKF